MSRLIQLAWTLPALTVIGIAAHAAIADCLNRPAAPGRSWQEQP